jgi:hypothetical protein
MKQYLAFFGATYYPSGGMCDLLGDFDTAEEAIQAIGSAHKEYDIHKCGWDGHVWCHVYDIVNRTFVYGCPIDYPNPVPGSLYETDDVPRMLREGEQMGNR